MTGVDPAGVLLDTLGRRASRLNDCRALYESRHSRELPKFDHRIAARWRNVGTDQTLVAIGADGSDPEHEVVDGQLWQIELRDVPDELCLLPVGGPRLAPVDAVGGCSGGGVPSEVGVVAGRLPADHHLAAR